MISRLKTILGEIMEFFIEERYGVVILKLKGQLSGGPFAEILNNQLHKLIEQKKLNIVVDMSNVSFMNSTGLGILISGHITMNNNSGCFKLAALSDHIDGILNLTKMNQIFQQYRTVDEAVSGFVS